MSIKTKQKSNKQPKKKNQSRNLLKNENHIPLNKTTTTPTTQEIKKKKKGKELDELPMCKCTSTFLSIKQSHFLPSIFLTF